MIEIREISGSDIFLKGFDDRIIAFDRMNMAQILADAGLPFPEEKRRKGFENNPTFVVAWKDHEIVGYLEYCRSWNNRANIYISSLQILAGCRRGAALLAILDYARKLLLSEDFDKIESGVQKNNSQAIQLYKKLGFSVADNPANDKTLIVSATKGILERESTLRLMDRHNNRMHRINR